MEEHEMHQIMFTQLVAMFHAATMQQLGKIKNPMTDAIERNLDAARNSIDILAMLQAKTRGNLSADEERFLKQVLQELRLNYVDESQKPEAPAENSQT